MIAARTLARVLRRLVRRAVPQARCRGVTSLYTSRPSMRHVPRRVTGTSLDASRPSMRQVPRRVTSLYASRPSTIPQVPVHTGYHHPAAADAHTPPQTAAGKILRCAPRYSGPAGSPTRRVCPVPASCRPCRLSRLLTCGCCRMIHMAIMMAQVSGPAALAQTRPTRSLIQVPVPWPHPTAP